MMAKLTFNKRKKLIICFLWGFCIPALLAQHIDHDATDGGRFLKKAEYNLFSKGGTFNGLTFGDSYNLSSKTDTEKLLFGNFNAPVEFFYSPSFEDEFGFRIRRDSLDTSFILEVKWVANYSEARKMASKEAGKEDHRINLPIKQLDSLPRNVFNLIFDHNKTIGSKIYSKELPKLLKADGRSFPISDQLAGKMYEKMVSFIGNFKAIGVPHIISDGYSVTFRTVVDDEVWSLYIHEPQENALKLSDLCRQIMTDAMDGKPDEAKYIKLLNEF
ncbi:MAG: hypothetical protein LBQ60_06370 [Bacteroidales bacterium]|jgi:hypothetical protein|nr:hypothetical protein [Bacteroidales bacterium]